MNFFKSILSDEPELENSDHSDGSEPNSPKNSSPEPQQFDEDDDDDDGDASSNPNSSEDIGGWSFGGFMKTISTRSESVLETYRRDLKEFGSGLKKETELFREVAGRAVKELPASIEVGTSAIDGVLKSTAEMISHGKDALLAPYDHDHESDTPGSQSSRVYSRFESQLIAIQNDDRTYCEDPEDLDDYKKFKLGFVLDDKKDEIEKLVGDNGTMEGMHKRVVPNEVDHDTFWCRYFYRVYKLKQQEDMRAKLVRRSLSADDEEELSWDVDDDEEDEEEEEAKKKLEHNVMENKESGIEDSAQVEKKESFNEDLKTESSVVVNEVNGNGESADKGGIGNVSDEKVVPEIKSEENVVDNGESCKDSDVSVVSTQPSLQEEDHEWDEIEDLGSHDEKKGSQSGSPNISDLKKRLSAAEEDEDLSWDIEDDDEPLKA